MKCVYCVNTFLAETFSHLETKPDSDMKMLMSKIETHSSILLQNLWYRENLQLLHQFIHSVFHFLSCQPVTFGEMHNYSEVILIRVLNVDTVYHATSGFICV